MSIGSKGMLLIIASNSKEVAELSCLVCTPQTNLTTKNVTPFFTSKLKRHEVVSNILCLKGQLLYGAGGRERSGWIRRSRLSVAWQASLTKRQQATCCRTLKEPSRIRKAAAIEDLRPGTMLASNAKT